MGNVLCSCLWKEYRKREVSRTKDGRERLSKERKKKKGKKRVCKVSLMYVCVSVCEHLDVCSLPTKGVNFYRSIVRVTVACHSNLEKCAKDKKKPFAFASSTLASSTPSVNRDSTSGTRTTKRPKMNALVNYGTDSDSDDDSDISPTPTHTTNQPAGTQAQSTASSNKDDDEDDPILAALKDLQDFAASVNENDSDPSSSNTAATSDAGVGSGETMEQDQEELKFLSFLQEIDAIPNPDDDQQPPPPPPPPPLESPKIIDDIPPPPPAPSSSTSTPPPPSTTQTDPGTTTESILQSVQMIYNRLDHISLLPSASTISQDLERRLLEFAVRIVDWKKGGLEEAYFLGQDLANALAQEAAAGVDGGGTNQGMTATLPDFGGIVGSMIQYMFRLEQMATPNGWMAVWDAEDEAYGFQHVRTVSCLNSFFIDLRSKMYLFRGSYHFFVLTNASFPR